MRESPDERLVRMTRYEGAYWASGAFPGGVDEAGRGPLAGPVVAACVIMPREPLLRGVNDSKKLSAPRREALYDEILATCISYGVGLADVGEIEELNIRQASRLAMARAVAACGADVILVDAERDLDVAARQTAIVGGDAQSYVIAAASILAKVYRDRIMAGLDSVYPAYGFAKHKGYGTAEHMQALRQHGPCPEHRSLFIRKVIA